MLLWVKISIFYGIPILAIVLAAAYFFVLRRRVRRGAITGERARRRYTLTLLLPIAAVLIVWATAEAASYLAVASDEYRWDAGAAFGLFIDLLPIAAYIGAPIAVLIVLFWLTISSARSG